MSSKKSWIYFTSVIVSFWAVGAIIESGSNGLGSADIQIPPFPGWLISLTYNKPIINIFIGISVLFFPVQFIPAVIKKIQIYKVSLSGVWGLCIVYAVATLPVMYKHLN